MLARALRQELRSRYRRARESRRSARVPRLPLSRLAGTRRHLPHGLGADMSQMVQRVAEKICDDLSCDATCEARPGLCERIAIAAIAALREPSYEMKRAFWNRMADRI